MSDRFLNTDKVDDLLDTLFLHEDVRVDLVSRLRGLVLAADSRHLRGGEVRRDPVLRRLAPSAASSRTRGT